MAGVAKQTNALDGTSFLARTLLSERVSRVFHM